MRIVLVGEEAAGVSVLRWLITSGHEVVGVLTGGEARSTPAVAAAARPLGLRVSAAAFVRDSRFGEWLERERIDLLLNVHSLFRIRGDALLVPRVGCFNLHPGPLPRYGGLNAPSWAIYHGETRHGATVHWMTPEIDAGAVAYQEEFEITPRDTGLSLMMKCIRAGVPLVSRVVEAAAAAPGSIPRIEQDPSERSYFPPGPPDGGQLSWSAPARKILDFVRAADYAPFPSPWGAPWTTLGGGRIEITKTSPTAESAKGATPGSVAVRAGDVMVAAADEWVLLERLRAEGAAAVPADVLRRGVRLGS